MEMAAVLKVTIADALIAPSWSEFRPATCSVDKDWISAVDRECICDVVSAATWAADIAEMMEGILVSYP